MSKEQYKGIHVHDVVNDQGLAMPYRAISLSHLEVFRCERINTAKQRDRLTSFLI